MIINNINFSPGQRVQIAGETWQIIQIHKKAQSVFFGRVLKNGELAKPNKATMGSYNFKDLKNYIELGAITH